MDYDYAIKMLEGDRIGGYLVLYGSPAMKDLQGEYFTNETELGLDWYDTRPVLYHHGLDGAIKAEVIGEIDTLRQDEVGIWAEAQLNIRKKYVKAIKKMIEQGVLQWSSGSLPHLVVKSADGFIRQWPIVEGSLTPAPAEPRMTQVATIKDYYASLGINFSELSTEAQDAATVKTETVKTETGDGADGGQNNINSEVEMSEKANESTETQVTPQDEPVTLQEIKGMFTEFGNELLQALKPEQPEPVKSQPVNINSSIVDKGVNVHPNPVGGGDDSDGMKAFYHYLRTGQQNTSLKALEGGTDSEGGFIVPSPQHTTIIERRDLASVVRQAPGFSMFTTTATTYDIPVEGDDSAAMDSTAEEAAATENDPVFANAAGTITKFTREIRLSDELIDDNDANLQTFLNSRVGREMAKAENASLHTALFDGGTAALTLDSNSAIGAGEVPEITGLLPASWESGAIWNMRKATGSLIRALQGNDFLFMPTPSAMGGNGSQWVLDGYPVFYNDQMDAMGADNQVITFYNPEAVGVIDRQGLTMLRDPYTLASTGQVKLIYKFRFDVIVLQAQAVLEIICPS